MPAFTTNQWVVLFLVFLLGWLLGLISRAGGAKWRRAYEAERDARIEEQREHAAALETSNARIVELERARPVAVAAPVAAAPLAAGPALEPVTITSIPPRTADTLDLTRDDLARIRGIGDVGEARLHEHGVYRYSDILALTPGDETALEDKLGADHGYIEQERWREQARLLQDGKLDEHRSAYPDI